MALEVVEAQNRAVSVDATGAQASAGVVSATSIDNVYAGRTRVALEPRMSSGDWYLVDNSIAGAMPWVLSFGRELEPVIADAMNDSRAPATRCLSVGA